MSRSPIGHMTGSSAFITQASPVGVALIRLSTARLHRLPEIRWLFSSCAASTAKPIRLLPPPAQSSAMFRLLIGQLRGLNDWQPKASRVVVVLVSTALIPSSRAIRWQFSYCVPSMAAAMCRLPQPTQSSAMFRLLIGQLRGLNDWQPKASQVDAVQAFTAQLVLLHATRWRCF